MNSYIDSVPATTPPKVAVIVSAPEPEAVAYQMYELKIGVEGAREIATSTHGAEGLRDIGTVVDDPTPVSYSLQP